MASAGGRGTLQLLIVSNDVVGARMAGPGIRCWELARVLSDRCRVTLAHPNAPSLHFSGIGQVRSDDVYALRDLVHQHDVIVLDAWGLDRIGEISQDKFVVGDLYDPFLLENLELSRAQNPDAREFRTSADRRLTELLLRRADFLLCASERQRDYWLGALAQTGRVNAQTYEADPSLERLLAVVPFGLPSDPPAASGAYARTVQAAIGEEDPVVLWGGGLWEWLDPLTLIRAVPRIAEHHPAVRLVFPGTRHPNDGVPDMQMRQKAEALARSLGLAGSHVFFGEWVPYQERANYLLEADIGVSLHFRQVETRMAFRTRMLDYIWAGLPIVATRGDVMSDWVREWGLGVVVDYEDADDVGRAISQLLSISNLRAQFAPAFARAAAALTWERAAAPLAAFCVHPWHAADRTCETPADSMETAPAALKGAVDAAQWYHTVDLGNGVVTPGLYDHRPYLAQYGLPDDLRGKTALDIGAASGFFSFELERRGATVTALDLPNWFDHDFGPRYLPDKNAEEGHRYLRDPFALARQALGSHVVKREMSVYEVSPETVGCFDLVFCGSVLIHLTDPIRALWNIQRVTREQAIIATVIQPDAAGEPMAQFAGHHRGDGWWIPNRAGLEAMVQAAGFDGWEWVSDFRLDFRDGTSGPYHGVIRAWNSATGGSASARVDQFAADVEHRNGLHVSAINPPAVHSRATALALAARDREIQLLRTTLAGYERGKFIRFMRWWHRVLAEARRQ